jgi:hypothetical protein
MLHNKREMFINERIFVNYNREWNKVKLKFLSILKKCLKKAQKK